MFFMPVAMQVSRRFHNLENSPLPNFPVNSKKEYPLKSIFVIDKPGNTIEIAVIKTGYDF